MKRSIGSALTLTVAGAACLMPVSVKSAPAGGELFMEHCAPCHGADGRGGTPAGRKLRAGNLPRTKLGTAEIALRIRDGVRTPKGAERMPAFGAKLSAEEIQAITETVIRLKK